MFLSLTVQAEEFSCPAGLQTAQSLYEYAYSSDEYYQMGSCSTNMWKFLKLLESCNVELNEAHILYVVEEDLNLTLEQSRQGPVLWYFHVVLEISGKIFDFDWGPSPKVVTKEFYFTNMFKSRVQSHWQKISVRIIPAEEYRNLYDMDRTAPYGFYYFLLPERSNYPQLSIPDYLYSIIFNGSYHEDHARYR